MHVGIELRSPVRGASGGIVPVLTGVLPELFQQRADIGFAVYCTPFNRELLATDLPNVAFTTLALDTFFADLDADARWRGLDVLFRSFPSAEELEFPRSRQVFLVPDAQHELHPEFFDAATLRRRRRSFGIAYEGAGAIATISEHARATIAAHANAGSDVFVMRPAVPREFAAASAADATTAERALVPADRFFLYPANLWPSKNHDRLLEAFGAFCDRTDAEMELVLTGALEGWDDLLARHEGVRVRHLGYVSAPLMRLLYDEATALTFFSLYEGFGIPLLEAFAAGTPVLCSDRTSLPEVAGDAALMCDPCDIGAMGALMERIVGDTALRAALVERGRERLKQSSWADAAAALADAIARVAAAAKDDPRTERPPLVSIVTHARESATAHVEEIAEVERTPATILGWVDPGAGLAPDAVAAMVEHLERRRDCDLVYVRADGATVGVPPTSPAALAALPLAPAAALWRRSVSAEAGPLDESLGAAALLDYLLRVAGLDFSIQPVPGATVTVLPPREPQTIRRRLAAARDVAATCRRHLGYVPPEHVERLWRELATDRSPRTRRIAALLTRLGIPRLHRRWASRGAPAPTPPTEDGGQPRVSGYWADNWIGDELRVVPGHTANDARLRVVGTAVADMTVEVAVEGEPVRTIDVRGDEQVTIELAPPAAGRTVSLRFSGATTRNGRALSFHVDSTNLFTEADLAARVPARPASGADGTAVAT